MICSQEGLALGIVPAGVRFMRFLAISSVAVYCLLLSLLLLLLPPPLLPLLLLPLLLLNGALVSCRRMMDKTCT